MRRVLLPTSSVPDGRVLAALLLTVLLLGSVSPPLPGVGFATAPLGAQVQVEQDDMQMALARVTPQLEVEIRRAMQAGQIPSVTVALTDREGELWAGAFGESNLWAGTPASTQTVYLIGSTFKAQSTVALLQQMEAGKFSLDDRVNDYLPGFQIRGERAASPVTFRHLFTHTSGLPAAYGGHNVWGETVPPPLPVYLADSLAVVRPPLQQVVYSNLAYSLVGYLVELFSEVPYKDYIQNRVWDPFGMTSTAFAPTPEMEERLSVPYTLDQRTGRPVAAGRTKANVWPAGIVYGTVHDQASWVRFNLGDGSFGGQQILQPSTMEEMFTLQYRQFAGRPMAGGWGYENPGYGLTWWTSSRDGERFFAHSGSVSGYTAFVMGNRTRGFGIALLTNGNRAHPHLVRISNLALDLLAEALGESR
jgi:CubicO group peptidase (beta-lactamase class C family)